MVAYCSLTVSANCIATLSGYDLPTLAGLFSTPAYWVDRALPQISGNERIGQSHERGQPH